MTRETNKNLHASVKYAEDVADDAAAKAVFGKVTNGGGVAQVKSLSQSDYDAIESPDASTLYVVQEDE